ncbi:peptidylprolyl isomerase [Lysobacteraceae bacterium NML07-0707]|nr:peptidylprolyl isomerase [Xanthomonadaceae bacterium NML07-0707]
MLQALREKSSGWVATVILGLLIVPFALFGIGDYMTGRMENYAAKIKTPPGWWQSAPSIWPLSKLWDEEEISLQDFRIRLDVERNQARQAQGEQFDSRAFESAENKRRILDMMVDERLAQIAAREAGMVIPDELVRRSIQSYPQFQVDGKFNAQRYQAMLSGANPPMTPRMFEATVRDDLMTVALTGALARSAFVSKPYGERLLSLLLEKRDVSALHIELKPDTAEVSAAEVEAWYKGHGDDYQSPETVTLEYVEVNAANLPEPGTDEAQLRARYEAQKSRFGTAEQRLVSHILIEADAAAGADAQKAAQEKAAQLAAQARAGADFAALAKANSADAGSAPNGGDLGWIERNGMMVKPFEDAVFATDGVAIAGPVKSDFGWHVIQVREVRGGTTRSFGEVREELLREEQANGRERAYNTLLGTLVDDLMKNPAGFAEAAAKHGLTVEKATLAKGAGQGILALPAVQREAFSDSRIQSGGVSDPVNITADHSVLLRVVSHQGQQPLALDKVRDQVVAAVRADRASKAAQKTADDMLAALRKGEPLAAQAAAVGAQLRDLPGIMRHLPVLTADAMKAIFEAPKPTEAAPSAGHVQLPDGSWMVFQVRAVHDGKDDQTMPPAERELLRQQLAVGSGNQAAMSLVAQLRKQVKIDVAESQL